MKYIEKIGDPISICNNKAEAVVFFHGLNSCPAGYVPYIEEAIQAGYDIYAPLYPGHGTVVEDMLEFTPEDWQRHVLSFMEELLPRYQKIHLAGHSLGGYMATFVAGTYASTGKIGKVLVMCPAVGLNPVTKKLMDEFPQDPVPIMESKEQIPEMAPYRKSYRFLYKKTLQDLADFIPSIFAYAEKITSPVSVIYSAKDDVVDATKTPLYIEKIQNLRSVYIYEEGKHNLLTGKDYKDVHERIVKWLEEKL